jgi:hypothetical protein
MTLEKRQQQVIKQVLLEFLESEEGRRLIQELARDVEMARENNHKKKKVT